MTSTKISKAAILIAILALVGALAIAGCGGSGGTTATEQGGAAEEEPNATKETEEAPAEEAEEEPAEEEPAEEAEEEKPAEEEAEEAGAEETGGAAASLSAEGKTVFTSNCGSCHTLQAAGTTGTVGPDLDELEPDLATVEHQVVNGGGPMPAFGKEGILNPKEVKAVATYVSAVAGNG
jgi:mono/diheme cytochrome c family protein